MKYATLRIKGTPFYCAPDLFKKGLLKPGMDVCLEHQPQNPYDRNAVAVFLKNSHAMLGHIAREYAPKYAKIVF
ncbi:MAG TPA: HIRAN domain-containing protein [Syntrophorhabdaceae bacterium]|nr:HIRAN domain-containing protein [Syntrophorhabdaceae bacterium]